MSGTRDGGERLGVSRLTVKYEASVVISACQKVHRTNRWCDRTETRAMVSLSKNSTGQQVSRDFEGRPFYCVVAVLRSERALLAGSRSFCQLTVRLVDVIGKLRDVNPIVDNEPLDLALLPADLV